MNDITILKQPKEVTTLDLRLVGLTLLNLSLFLKRTVF